MYLHFLFCIFLCSQLYFLGKTYFSQVTSSQKKGCTRLNRLTHKGFETFSLLFPYLSLFCGNFFRWYSSEKKSCTRLNKSTDWPWAKRVQRGNCRPTLLYLHFVFCISAVLAFHILYFYCACIPHFVFLLCLHLVFLICCLHLIWPLVLKAPQWLVKINLTIFVVAVSGQLHWDKIQNLH